MPGTYAFRVLGYGTADPLEVVLAPGYFATAGSLLRPGELIYVRMLAAEGDQPSVAAAGPAHMALLMVCDGASRSGSRPGLAASGSTGRRGGAEVRLVQDFGRSDAPAADRADAPADPAPPPRRRGTGTTPQTRPRPPTRQPEQEKWRAGSDAAELTRISVPAAAPKGEPGGRPGAPRRLFPEFPEFPPIFPPPKRISARPASAHQATLV